MQDNDNYCDRSGFLVGANGVVPADRRRYRHAQDPDIGCNELGCDSCGQQVRQMPRVELTDPEAVRPVGLFRQDDWLQLPFIRQRAESTARLYACACMVRSVTWPEPMGPEFPMIDESMHQRWQCMGHDPEGASDDADADGW